MTDQGLQEYRERQRLAFLKRSREAEGKEEDGDCNVSTSASSSAAGFSRGEKLNKAHLGSGNSTNSYSLGLHKGSQVVENVRVPPTTMLRQHTFEEAEFEVNDTSNDAIIAEALAKELEREHLAALSKADSDVDPETAAVIARLLESEVDHLESQEMGGMRPPDTTFQEQLISSDNSSLLTECLPTVFPWCGARTSASGPLRSVSPEISGEAPAHAAENTIVPTESDDELARRMQEEEFLRDSPCFSPAT